jgi:non-ribosomal peptide synthetase component F
LGGKEGIDIISIDEEQEKTGRESSAALELQIQPGNLVYVIYTSGSTGRPKGISMPDSAMVNLLLWQEEQVWARTDKRVLQFASINFDASFQEIFTTLCFGGCLFLIDEEARKDAGELLAMVEAKGISYLFMPYVVLKNLCEYAEEFQRYPKCLHAIITAGEQLRLSEDIRKFSEETGAKILNHYGPAETHVVSCYEVKPEDYAKRPLPPIGKPISNTSLYILDKHGGLCATGIAGDIHIGGVQVARGYWNNNALTRERFIDDPVSGDPGSRLYRTGDLGR